MTACRSRVGPRRRSSSSSPSRPTTRAPYFLAHKEQYETSVKAPFLALSEEITKEFGPLHLFRPNRDTRFAKDKSPYKTTAAAVTEGKGGASYYVQISAEGLYVGSGYYHLASDQLERFRNAVADNRRGRVIRNRGRRIAQAEVQRRLARIPEACAPRFRRRPSRARSSCG